MPQFGPTWNIGQNKLNLGVPLLVRYANQTFGTDYAIPADITQLNAFLKDVLLQWMVLASKRQKRAEDMPMVEVDLDNEVAGHWEED